MMPKSLSKDEPTLTRSILYALLSCFVPVLYKLWISFIASYPNVLNDLFSEGNFQFKLGVLNIFFVSLSIYFGYHSLLNGERLFRGEKKILGLVIASTGYSLSFMVFFGSVFTSLLLSYFQ